MYPIIQKLAVCFAVFIVASAVAVMSVSAWRKNATEYVLSLFDDHGVFSVKEISYGTIDHEFVPSRIPETYSNMEVVINSVNELIVYYYGDDYNHGFSYHLYRTPTNVLVDTENAEMTKVEHNGVKYEIITKDGIKQLIGIIPETGNQYILIGEFTNDTLIDIADSISRAKEK